MKSSNYTFHPVAVCEMCQSSSGQHKVLGQRLNQSQGYRPKSKTGISVSVMQCRNCGLIFSNPMPIPADILDHYGMPAEDYWRPEYFLPDESYFSDQVATLQSLMPIQPGMKALDIGAGLGKCMTALEKAGLDAYGFEPSPPFYQKALDKMKVSPDKLRLGKMEDMDYPGSTFDFITFGAVLEHLYWPAESIERAMKWLKPNGIIHVEVPSVHYTISKIFNAYYWLRGTNYVTHLSPMHSPYHMYEFDARSFTQLGKRLGFEVAREDYFVGEIIALPSFIKPLLTAYMRWRKSGMQLSIWLRKK